MAQKSLGEAVRGEPLAEAEQVLSGVHGGRVPVVQCTARAAVQGSAAESHAATQLSTPHPLLWQMAKQGRAPTAISYLGHTSHPRGRSGSGPCL